MMDDGILWVSWLLSLCGPINGDEAKSIMIVSENGVGV